MRYLRKGMMCEGLLRVLVIAFACRALIPVGYMPDLGALSHGLIKIVICTGSGSHMVMLDGQGQPQSNQSQGHAHQPCAFSGMAAVTLFDAVIAPVVGPERVAVVLRSGHGDVVPPARAGPPMGARGPPVVS